MFGTTIAMLAVAIAAFVAPPCLFPDRLPTTGQRAWVDGSDAWGPTCTVAVATVPGGQVVYRRPCSQLPREALRRLKTQAAAPLKVRPGFRQVTAARMTGETPDDIEGTVVWRTVFGLPVGETRISGARWTHDHHQLNWWLAWGTLLLVEGALARLLYKQLGLERPL